MTSARRLLALALTLALGAALTACSNTPSGGSAYGPPGSLTSSVEQTATAGEGTQAAPAGAASASEVKAMDQQLDAMQKELDTLKMPTDDDFGQAESALY